MSGYECSEARAEIHDEIDRVLERWRNPLCAWSEAIPFFFHRQLDFLSSSQTDTRYNLLILSRHDVAGFSSAGPDPARSIDC